MIHMYVAKKQNLRKPIFILARVSIFDAGEYLGIKISNYLVRLQVTLGSTEKSKQIVRQIRKNSQGTSTSQ